MIRSVVSVIAGAVVWAALWQPGTLALGAAFPNTFIPDVRLEHAGALLTLIVLSVVASVAAGWVTAAVARTKPLQHGLALGSVQLAIGVAFEISYWELLPVWYHLLFLALSSRRTSTVPGSAAARSNAAW